jgi:hypothetical protein
VSGAVAGAGWRPGDTSFKEVENRQNINSQQFCPCSHFI